MRQVCVNLFIQVPYCHFNMFWWDSLNESFLSVQLVKKKALLLFYFLQQGIKNNIAFHHSDGYVRSPVGPPHYHHATAANRRPVEHTSNGSATSSPVEGANIVSKKHQYSFCSFLLSLNATSSWILSFFTSPLYFGLVAPSPRHNVSVFNLIFLLPFILC